eukprot:SAG31_NODE_3079_length_4706_cov_3.887779_8_plen_91_part_00
MLRHIVYAIADLEQNSTWSAPPREASMASAVRGDSIDCRHTALLPLVQWVAEQDIDALGLYVALAPADGTLVARVRPSLHPTPRFVLSLT